MDRSPWSGTGYVGLHAASCLSIVHIMSSLLAQRRPLGPESGAWRMCTHRWLMR
jgi:hypothetical protein